MHKAHVAKKRFGQNFLKDESVLHKIIQSMPKNSHKIAEIGPGLGDLTRFLVEVKSVTAFEVDTDLCKYLDDRFHDAINTGRLTLRCGDVLDAWKTQLLDEPYDLVANLPYYIATNIILKALADPMCRHLLVMVQREVAEKFAAKAGERNFGALSVIAQSVAQPSIVTIVPPEAFDPPPKVDSALLLLLKTADRNDEAFEAMLRAAFVQPRKTLYKNLSIRYDKPLIEAAFVQLGLAPSIRPHQVGTPDYHRLYLKLHKGIWMANDIEETATPHTPDAAPAAKRGENRRRRRPNRNQREDQSSERASNNRERSREPREPREERGGHEGSRDRGNRSASGRSSIAPKGDDTISSGGGRRGSATPVDKNLLEFVKKNQEMHKNRLNPHYKVNLESNAKVRITPLGGLGEIGGNITVFETENEAIVVDVGMSFPDSEMHGVDILVPDFTYLREIKKKIVAVIITHAHEDHIGAVPYLFKEMQFPIYGTPLPLAMIGAKFDEHHMKEFRRYLNPIVKREVYKIGNDFEIEWMHMTHSIIDSSSLAIKTEAGTIIHTGDFKIDHTPVDGYTADLHRLAYYGEQGVLCLLSDSTNSYNKEHTPSELSVAPALDRIFSKTEGRVILSTFSSNIHRVYQAIQYGVKYNRKVCVIGRSMERNLEAAMQYDYVRFPKGIFVDAEYISKINDKEVLIVTTGSQGEANSALFRMAIGEHRHIKIKPTDLIILSARPIPGNEASISGMLNHLQRAGATVYYERDIHVSGHAGIEEQKLMLRLTNPKFFLPVHGEYNHIMRHRQTAIECGVPERNILLMTDGDCIEVAPKYMRKVKTVKVGKTYIDNQNNHQIEDDIVIDRQKMATDGVVLIVAQVSEADSTLITRPRVTSFGLVSDKNDHAFAKEIEDVLEQFMANIKPNHIENPRSMENDIRQVVRKHIYRKQKKYPFIVPHVFIM